MDQPDPIAVQEAKMAEALEKIRRFQALAGRPNQLPQTVEFYENLERSTHAEVALRRKAIQYLKDNPQPQSPQTPISPSPDETAG